MAKVAILRIASPSLKIPCQDACRFVKYLGVRNNLPWRRFRPGHSRTPCSTSRLLTSGLRLRVCAARLRWRSRLAAAILLAVPAEEVVPDPHAVDDHRSPSAPARLRVCAGGERR